MRIKEKLSSCRDAACRVSRPVSTRDPRPQHSCSRHRQNCAQDSPQPEHGNARAHMRAQDFVANRADRQGNDPVWTHVACQPVQQAGDAGQNHCVGHGTDCGLVLVPVEHKNSHDVAGMESSVRFPTVFSAVTLRKTAANCGTMRDQSNCAANCLAACSNFRRVSAL